MNQFKTKEKNYTITIARVISMLMIIGCHLSSWLGINILAMILNVGVYIFLIISGILYSLKPINNVWTFVRRRYLKLCVPMYVLATFLVIQNMCHQNIEVLKSIPTYLFNLQGVEFVVYGFHLSYINGLEHLWFLTVIMACYLVLPIVKKMEHYKYWKTKKAVVAIMTVLFALSIALLYLANVQIYYFIAYFIGYLIGKDGQKLSKRSYTLMTVTMIFAMIIRILMQKNLDGTILYNNIIVSVTHIILAIWIYSTIRFASENGSDLIRNLAQSKLINWIENLSIYLYMTHYMFLIGPFYVSDFSNSKIIQLLFFFVGTLLSACLLKYITEKIFRLLHKTSILPDLFT